MAIEEKSLVDALYCSEEQWNDVVQDLPDDNDVDTHTISLSLLEQDLFWDDDELHSLFSKESQTPIHPSLSLPRKESVDWILKTTSHYSFSPLTAILAVNFLDRFLSTLPDNDNQPWMMQLAAVTCLSLAAKVEETHVPLLLDLQVEDTKYVFESKTIQRMELLVLSSLQWRMNPVTPVSFLDHIIRRLGLRSYIHWEFLNTCETLLLSVVSDPRYTMYLPSVLATAAMLHVIHRLEPRRAAEYESQLLSVLTKNKEEVDECYEVIRELDSISNTGLKRKMSQGQDGEILSDSSSICKKARVGQQQQQTPSPLSAN
ncbi:cyclin-D3-1-like [Salvia hispanica]|uniref:cyclin-D3-1-like n=1 Tax=Salvia hispanica TaxID=49212 RepID=UPI0020097547|nr:cyclin-D3-1-like [Salvia hispanica]